MTTTPLNYYQVLMVDAEVDPDLLTTVYRRLVQRYQSPLDRSGAALERLRAVDAAYAVLSDPRRRARYDAQLEEGRRDNEPFAATVAPQTVTLRPPMHPAARSVTMPIAQPAAVSAAPTGTREAFSRATVALRPATRSTVPNDSQRPASARSAQVSVLDFGRYAGWTLRQLAARDPNYLEWLLRSPGGRQYRAEITALLAPR